MTPTFVPHSPKAIDPLEFQAFDFAFWIGYTEDRERYRAITDLRFKVTDTLDLAIPRGWEFNGASGGAIDAISNIIAALVHDGLYDALVKLGKEVMAVEEPEEMV